MTNNPALNNQVPQAFERFVKVLKDGGMNDESVGFLLGRMINLHGEKVLEKITMIVGEDQLNQVRDLPEEEKLDKLIDLYQTKSGKDIASLRTEVAEELVKEFETA